MFLGTYLHTVVHTNFWFFYVDTLDGSVYSIKKTDALVVASKEIGLEVNADKTVYGQVLKLEYRTKPLYKD
jgi:hypothetical protein